MATDGWQQRMASTRRTIRDVAVRAFHRRGFDAVSVAEVARLAGVTERTVFRYFPTKADLVYSATDVGGWATLIAALEARPASEAIRDSLLAAAMTLAPTPADDVLERLQSELIVATPLLRQRWLDSLQSLQPLLADWIGRRTGRDPSDGVVDATAALLVAGHRYAMEQWLAKGTATIEAFEKQVLDVLAGGFETALAARQSK